MFKLTIEICLFWALVMLALLGASQAAGRAAGGDASGFWFDVVVMLLGALGAWRVRPGAS